MARLCNMALCLASSAWLVLTLIACDRDGSGMADPPFECWYRTTSYGWLTMWPCPLAGCSSTGSGDEIICSCSRGCDCEMEPDPDNPEDGALNMFACSWIYEICYKGPQGHVYPPPDDCFCYGGYYCWMECEGKLGADGGMVCLVDGKEVGCQEVPPRDELGRVVVCRFGAAPIDWPLAE